MIALNLDKIMKERGIKLKDLAVKIGLTDANLSNIKTGKVSAIRFSTLDAICDVLDCQPGDLLEFQRIENSEEEEQGRNQEEENGKKQE